MAVGERGVRSSHRGEGLLGQLVFPGRNDQLEHVGYPLLGATDGIAAVETHFTPGRCQCHQTLHCVLRHLEHAHGVEAREDELPGRPARVWTPERD